MNTFRRGIVASEITTLCDLDRRLRILIGAEERALEAQPDAIENSPHSAGARVVIIILKKALDDVGKAIHNLRLVLDSENIEHIDVGGEAPCSA